MNYIPNKKLVELSYQPTFGLAICSCKIVNHDFQTLSKCQTASADDKKNKQTFWTCSFEMRLYDDSC